MPEVVEADHEYMAGPGPGWRENTKYPVKPQRKIWDVRRVTSAHVWTFIPEMSFSKRPLPPAPWGSPLAWRQGVPAPSLSLL